MDLGLRGAGVLVTGGSGAIGAATAEMFAAEGASVAVHYRNNAKMGQEVARRTNGIAIQGDLRKPEEAERVVAAAASGLGNLQICVANAGSWLEPAEDIWETSVERFEAVVDANLRTTWLTARSFLRHVKATGHGTLILVSSTAAVFGEAGKSEYAAAKAGIAYGLCRSLKNEIVKIAPQGRVNVVAPGATRTPAVERALNPEAMGRAIATRPLKRLAEAEDVARAIVWLSSDVSAAHVTGEIVVVAGGMEGRLL